MSRAAMVLVDFSTLQGGPGDQIDTVTGYYWNSLAVTGGATYSFALLDSEKASTGLNLSFTTPVSAGANNAGATTGPLPTWIGQNWISQDNLFVNNGSVTMTLSGLMAGESYDFTFYSSRMAAGSRVSNFTVASGASTGSASLDAANNTFNTVTITAVADLTGTATITMASDSGASSFAYLNAMQVASVPEPASFAMCLLGGSAILMVSRRRTGGHLA